MMTSLGIALLAGLAVVLVVVAFAAVTVRRHPLYIAPEEEWKRAAREVGRDREEYR